MQEKNKFAIVAVLVVAVIVSYLIYASLTPPPEESATEKVLSRQLTGEEKAVLNFPAADAPEEVKREHFELASKLAEVSPTLDVTDCNLQPLVLSAEIERDLTLKNTSIYDVEVYIEGKNYIVPPEDEIVIKAGFGKGGGLYGYSCNSTAPDTLGTGSGLIILGAE